jgi:hypothetical protein
MKYRLATHKDIEEIVALHYDIRKIYPVGIFAQLGKSFLRQYYKIILSSPNEVVVCAENEKGEVLGFCNGSLNVEKFFFALQKHKIALGLAALIDVIKKPKLVKELINRYSATKNEASAKFTFTIGARGGYWAWSINNPAPEYSIEMHDFFLTILKERSVDTLYIEVDVINKQIFLFHKLNGAKIIETITLSDGRERAMMKYDLINRKSIIKI